MSSQIVNQIRHICGDKSDMLVFIDFMHETLAEYTTRIMRENDLSGYQIERSTNRAISQSYVNRIKNGDVLTPSTAKLVALAKGLGRPFTELLAVVRGINPDAVGITHDRLATIDFAYEGMPKKKRQRVDYVIELMEREIRRIQEEPE